MKSVLSILLPPPKSEYLDSDDYVKVLYSKDDCILSVIEDYTCNNESNKLWKGLMSARIDNYISQALLDYSLYLLDENMETILKRSLANYAMEGRYYKYKHQYQRCNGKI